MVVFGVSGGVGSARIYGGDGGDLSVLDGRTIAVIGYGN